MSTPIIERKTTPTYEFDKAPIIKKEEKLITKQILKQGIFLLVVTAAMVNPSLNSGVVINSQVKPSTINFSKINYSLKQNSNYFSFLGSFSGFKEGNEIREIEESIFIKAQPKSTFAMPHIEMQESSQSHFRHNENNEIEESIGYKATPKRIFEL